MAWSRSAAGCLSALALILGTHGEAAAGPDEVARSVPRVRTDSRALQSAIADARAGSRAFATLHDAVADTDGLVYLEEGRCGLSAKACLHQSVRDTGLFRLLRIVVDTRRRMACSIQASIGHELQHALEVLSEPLVRQDADVFFLFRRIGLNGMRSFETEAAVRAGDAISRELCP